MWKLYDELIAAVPEDAVVAECLAGLSWFLVRSLGTGVAMRPREIDGPVRNAGKIAGMKVRELAAWIKSWNWYEAAMGLAAINSALNAQQAVLTELRDVRWTRRGPQDVFTCLLDELRGKRVAVVGHFHNLERLSDICELSILERKPDARRSAGPGLRIHFSRAGRRHHDGDHADQQNHAAAACTQPECADRGGRTEHAAASADV